jgi:hypothetical protein
MRHCIQCSQPTAVQASGGNFGYVRGKGFKTENIVDYTSAEEDGFRKEGSLLLEQMKSILRFVSSLMRNCLLSSVKILIMHQYLFEAFHTVNGERIDISH